MRPINLYLLTREQDPGLFSAYEAHLSGRGQRRQANGREQVSAMPPAPATSVCLVALV